MTNNVSFNNMETNVAVPFGQRTDGNGIIIDDCRNSQTGHAPPYTGPGHVAYNLVHGNGGKGIQVCWSDNFVVDHNTAYDNNQDVGNVSNWRGEINSASSSNTTFANNVAYAVPVAGDVRVNDTAYLSEPSSNFGLQFTTNLSFNGTPGAKSLSPSMLKMALPLSNMLGVNPLFVSTDPSSINLALKTTSPIYYKDIGFR